MRLHPGRAFSIVAGGSGFLGSHLCEQLLERGEAVLCVDNFLTGSRRNLASIAAHPDFRVLGHDVCEPLQVTGRVSRVYNLACAASPPHYQADPVHTMRTCVVGTLNLLELAERHGARFLQASTSEVYGDPDVHPQDETYTGNVNCTGPRACYDEGKRAAEALCFDFLRAARADVRVARIFNTYGPRMHPQDGRVVSNFIVQALSGGPLTVYGDGSQTRSFCYVEDLIRGLVGLMEAELAPDGPVNLGNPAEYTVRELAQTVIEMTGSKSRLEFGPIPIDDPQRRRPGIARAIANLGWKPATPLREGLAKTIEYFRELGAADPMPAPLRARKVNARSRPALLDS